MIWEFLINELDELQSQITSILKIFNNSQKVAFEIDLSQMRQKCPYIDASLLLNSSFKYSYT